MSADYDRLFHSSEPGKPVDDATITVDRDAILKATAATPRVPAGEKPPADAPSGAMPVAPTQTQSAATPSRTAEPQVPPPMPPPPATAPQLSLIHI